MRIRAHPVLLTLLVLVPIAACAPEDGGEAVESDTAEAADTGVEIQEEPVFGSREMPCDTVAAYLESEGIAAPTSDSIAVVVEEGRATARPPVAVVDTGARLRWNAAEGVSAWVVAFKDGHSPFADGHVRDHGRAGAPSPGGDRGRIGDVCGRFVYVVAATREDSVFVSDPHLWVR